MTVVGKPSWRLGFTKIWKDGRSFSLTSRISLFPRKTTRFWIQSDRTSFSSDSLSVPSQTIFRVTLFSPSYSQRDFAKDCIRISTHLRSTSLPTYPIDISFSSRKTEECVGRIHR